MREKKVAEQNTIKKVKEKIRKGTCIKAGFELVTTRPVRAEQILSGHGVSCYKGSFLRTLNCISLV